MEILVPEAMFSMQNPVSDRATATRTTEPESAKTHIQPHQGPSHDFEYSEPSKITKSKKVLSCTDDRTFVSIFLSGAFYPPMRHLILVTEEDRHFRSSSKSQNTAEQQTRIG